MADSQHLFYIYQVGLGGQMHTKRFLCLIGRIQTKTYGEHIQDKCFLCLIARDRRKYMLSKSKKPFCAHLLIQIHHFAGEEFSYLVLSNRAIEGMSSAFKSKNQVVVRVQAIVDIDSDFSGKVSPVLRRIEHSNVFPIVELSVTG